MTSEATEERDAGAAPAFRVGVLADDLIWGTRLADLVRRSGAVAVPLRSTTALAEALPALDRVLVDLTARAYDGVEALRAAASAGVPAVAVAQHDDVPLRQAALAAGASRVHPYRVLAERGDAVVRAWLGGRAR